MQEAAVKLLLNSNVNPDLTNQAGKRPEDLVSGNSQLQALLQQNSHCREITGVSHAQQSGGSSTGLPGIRECRF